MAPCEYERGRKIAEEPRRDGWQADLARADTSRRMPGAKTRCGKPAAAAARSDSDGPRGGIGSAWVLASAAVALGAALLLGLRWHWPPPRTPLAQCQRLDASTLTAQRFNELVRRGQPAVLVGADSLPELRTAARRWGQRDYLLRSHGDVRLQVSLSDSEVFEGVEQAASWPGAEGFWRAWRRDGSQQQSDGASRSAAAAAAEALSAAGSRYQPCSEPSSRCLRHIYDRVVVRPAPANTTLRQVLTGDLPQRAAAGYVQYESIPEAMSLDVRVPSFAASLKAEFYGLWLGRGRTHAQLHHDANENLLLMVRGSKTWRLYPPTAGDALHEGYMLEVQQRLSAETETQEAAAGAGAAAAAAGWGHRRLERAPVGLRNASLSFFTSPVSLGALPDWERFPLADAAEGYECTLEKGDMIFVPSWWWHEVATSTERELPDPDARAEAAGAGADRGMGGGVGVDWSVAVNFWFEPYWVKPYGCATCKLQRNTAAYSWD
jgi:hypothetical protein